MFEYKTINEKPKMDIVNNEKQIFDLNPDKNNFVLI